jgi:hypothetical protein
MKYRETITLLRGRIREAICRSCKNVNAEGKLYAVQIKSIPPKNIGINAISIIGVISNTRATAKRQFAH